MNCENFQLFLPTGAINLSQWRTTYPQERIQRGFATGQPVWDPKLLPQIYKKLNILK